MAKEAGVPAKPEGYHSLTPYLTVGDAAGALRFYTEAFGAEELFRPDGPAGRIGHAEMQIGDSRFMLADEMESWGNRSPQSLNGTPIALMLYVDDDDCDTVFQRAVEAGAKEVQPLLEDKFYGDRSGMVGDPFGHLWGRTIRPPTIARDGFFSHNLE